MIQETVGLLMLLEESWEVSFNFAKAVTIMQFIETQTNPWIHGHYEDGLMVWALK